MKLRRRSLALAGYAFAAGAALNFLWEVAQSGLYVHEGLTGSAPAIADCAIAALLDGAAIALLYVLIAALWREPEWPSRPTITQRALLPVVGGAGAVLMERIALSSAWWSYASSMPIVPVANVGLAPLLQFVVLPPVVLLLIVPRVRLATAQRRATSEGDTAPASSVHWRG